MEKSNNATCAKSLRNNSYTIPGKHWACVVEGHRAVSYCPRSPHCDTHISPFASSSGNILNSTLLQTWLPIVTSLCPLLSLLSALTSWAFHCSSVSVIGGRKEKYEMHFKTSLFLTFYFSKKLSLKESLSHWPKYLLSFPRVSSTL